MSKHRSKQQRFVQLHHWLLNTAAWKDLSAVERSIYVELLFRYNGQNNGRIGYSARTAANALKIGKATAARALRSLQSHGFIVVEKRGAFHCKIRHASEYRLTAYDSDIATNYADKLCTKEFTRWPKIQMTVPPVRLTGRVVIPNGQPSDTVSSNNSPNGAPSETVEAIPSE
jgi:predicted transcriptional regulator